MKEKVLQFNAFFNSDGENLEDLVVKALINYLNETKHKGLTKC